MLPKIELENQYWSRFEDASLSVDFIGYIEFLGDMFLTADDIGGFLQNRGGSGRSIIKYLSDSFLPEVNGNFALVLCFQNTCILICDYSRTFPLFIVNSYSSIIVSDHIGNVEFQKLQDNLAMEEFLLSGVVSGNRTVFKNVANVGAGEMAIFNSEDIEYRKYYTLSSNPFSKSILNDKKSTFLKMDNLFLEVFRRMIRSYPDVNNWVVPLSGGHDSRLIINYLYRLGCKNVICFSYGETSSKEAEISRLAAEALGYEWYYVEYTPQQWGELHENRLFEEYINYSFNGCSLPHPQDLLAIFKLKEMSVITGKDAIVPGHTAFTEAESHLVKEIGTKSQSLMYVFNKYFNLFECQARNSSFDPILNKLFESGEQNCHSFPEYYNWYERQAKFINNSGRVYDFFGLNWRLPFWERCVIDFWQSIGYDDRIGRAILFDASKELLFIKALKDIPIINKFEKTKPSKGLVRRIIPQFVLSVIVRLLNKKSIIAEGTNLIFAERTNSVYSLVGPIKMFPSNLRRHIRKVLPRRTYQVNSSAIQVIFTLKNEVISRSSS